MRPSRSIPRSGPGLLESVYETCLEYELKKRRLRVVRQMEVTINYDDQQLDDALPWTCS